MSSAFVSHHQFSSVQVITIFFLFVRPFSDILYIHTSTYSSSSFYIGRWGNLPEVEPSERKRSHWRHAVGVDMGILVNLLSPTIMRRAGLLYPCPSHSAILPHDQ